MSGIRNTLRRVALAVGLVGAFIGVSLGLAAAGGSPTAATPQIGDRIIPPLDGVSGARIPGARIPGASIPAADRAGDAMAGATLAPASPAEGSDPAAAAPPPLQISLDRGQGMLREMPREMPVERQIAELRRRLAIAPAQEPQFAALAEILRANARLEQIAVQKAALPRHFGAVEALNASGELAAFRAEALKRLAPAFAALYRELTPEQQRAADLLFGEPERAAARRVAHSPG